MPRIAKTLTRERGGDAIQAFAADPAKVQAPFALDAASKTFVAGPGGDFDITDWLVASITPSSANLLGYFNEDTEKTWTIFSGQPNLVFIHQNVSKITITGTDIRVEVAGM